MIVATKSRVGDDKKWKRVRASPKLGHHVMSGGRESDCVPAQAFASTAVFALIFTSISKLLDVKPATSLMGLSLD